MGIYDRIKGDKITPPVTMDSKVRALRVCIGCGGTKDVGLVVCWPCHRGLKRAFDGGYGPHVERFIDGIESGKYTVDEQGRLDHAGI